jgi:hypothetical protein
MYASAKKKLGTRGGEDKAKTIYDPPVVEVKSCRVTVCDMEGVAHTVEVAAATLDDLGLLG